MTVGVADTEVVLEGLADTRERTLELTAPLSDADVEAQHSALMSPLAWDLAHIAAYEDLWLVHRFGDRPLLHADLAATYDAFETPRSARGQIELLDRPGAEAYLEEVRARTLDVIADRGIGDGTLFELVIRHEHQHRETMLQTVQLARLAGFAPPAPPEPRGPGGLTGLEAIAVPAGPAELGAAADGFAYDNERPRHIVDVPAFRIGRTPITNATWRHFAEGGGYERRTLWTEEAWSWKEQYDITHPLHWSDDGHEWRMGTWVPLDPDKPVVHVSWFEADAFARAHGARLPTELEWEKAATWDQETERIRPPSSQHANLDQRTFGTHPVGAYPEGASPSGALGMLGDVWEWTASDFRGYPGFRAHPYPEYSEVFFGPDYKVLRGGSWATVRRVATAHFRNWDLPRRRQIFSGVRLAWDACDVETTRLNGQIRIDSWLTEGDERTLADDVLDGLTKPFKELPPKHFYDTRGSELFDRICELPEYYPTRTERAILETHAADIVEAGQTEELLELGSGYATKTRVLLDAMAEAGTLRRYLPFDVAESVVRQTAEDLIEAYPGLDVYGVVGDFERHLDRVPRSEGPRTIAFLGGTIGNFPPGSRRRFLRGIAARMDPADRLLLGTDLVKDPELIRRAYDDDAGITAEFNRNLLHVVNRELGADFDPDGFEHVALFDADREWIEMRLRALRTATVTIPALNLEVSFAAGEEVRTEISAKFTRERVEGDYAAAGLRLTDWWTDPQRLFALSLAAPR